MNKKKYFGTQNPNFRWPNEKLEEEAKKYNNKLDFLENSPNIYRIAYRRGILNKICSHMKKHSFANTNNPNYKWTTEELQKEALQYNTRVGFQKESPRAYQAAYARNILDKVCTHMPKHDFSGINSPNFIWTYEKLEKEALLYNTRVEFQKGNSGAYQTAQNRGILNKICSHMTYICYPWTNEELSQEALKYNTKNEFRKNNHRAYQAANYRKISDAICSHMSNPSNISILELDLFNAIKQKYPKTQKLRDRKVKIENRPYIKGLDIDLYIPELRKGIEFDGTYWHSVSGLKRSRDHWPEADLKNYHQIKDEYFSNKGIRILHIKEKDWLKDKETCIKQCIEFLENA